MEDYDVLSVKSHPSLSPTSFVNISSPSASASGSFDLSSLTHTKPKPRVNTIQHPAALMVPSNTFKMSPSFCEQYSNQPKTKTKQQHQQHQQQQEIESKGEETLNANMWQFLNTHKFRIIGVASVMGLLLYSRESTQN